jgi:hypothetical protein
MPFKVEKNAPGPDPMAQKTALILLVEPRIVEVSQRTLEGLGHRYLFARDHEEALEALKKERVDLLIWTIRKKDEDFAFFDKAQKLCPSCPGIAFIDESLEQYFPELLRRAWPRNLIADNCPPDYAELTATIRKLLTGDIFGISKYGVPPEETIAVASSGEKYGLIQKVSGFYRSKGVQGRLVQNVELILNELLMNAIFDAPTDAGGQKRYYHLSRSEVFPLAPGERPEVQYGINNDRLAVSVSDPFGNFRKETFFSCVNRCFSEKSVLEDQSQGAGMGLFMAFKALNQMVINVDYRKKTEVIAMIDHHASAGELKKKRHSFHYFHLGDQP